MKYFFEAGKSSTTTQVMPFDVIRVFATNDYAVVKAAYKTRTGVQLDTSKGMVWLTKVEFVKRAAPPAR